MKTGFFVVEGIAIAGLCILTTAVCCTLCFEWCRRISDPQAPQGGTTPDTPDPAADPAVPAADPAVRIPPATYIVDAIVVREAP